jgi:hypothetical protein
MSTPSRTRLTAIASTLVAGLLVVGAVAAPGAQAKTKRPAPVIAAANGTVGIAETVTVVAAGLANQTVTLLFSLNGTSIVQQPVTLNAQGGGSIQITPPAAGAWTITGVGALASAAPLNITVSPITTTTVLSSVNQAQAGVATTMTIQVESNAGNYVPAGSVVIGNGAGVTYGTAALVGSGSGLATTSFSWTPPSPGVFPVVATYQPAAGLGGTANAVGSSSSDSIQVLATVPLVTLRLPTVFVIGAPVTMTAVISNPQLTGSAAFLNTINGTQTGISGSIPLSGSQSSMVWTPTALGNQSITADFSASNANTSGSSTQAIVVQPLGAPDPMSVSGNGLGVLRVNVPVTAGTSQRIAISTSSGSGAAVNLSEGGPCLLVGGTLVTPSSPGTCILTASSPGGAQFSANTASFVINVTRS